MSHTVHGAERTPVLVGIRQCRRGYRNKVELRGRLRSRILSWGIDSRSDDCALQGKVVIVDLRKGQTLIVCRHDAVIWHRIRESKLIRRPKKKCFWLGCGCRSREANRRASLVVDCSQRVCWPAHCTNDFINFIIIL